MTIQNKDSKTEVQRGVMRWLGQMIVFLVIYGILLFLAAGRLNWTLGWAFLGINALTQILSGLILIPRRPDMIAERSKIREGTKDWDRLLTPLIAIFGTIAMIITAGLDARFGWTHPVSGGLWGMGLVLVFCSQIFVLWAMSSNPFFATTVRIQSDRGHNVVSNGPYQFVRHPGYLGSVVFNLVAPLALGSLWTFIPALITIVLILIRTRLEDRTLLAELPGYLEYATKTRYRIIPGVW